MQLLWLLSETELIFEREEEIMHYLESPALTVGSFAALQTGSCAVSLTQSWSQPEVQNLTACALYYANIGLFHIQSTQARVKRANFTLPYKSM